MVNGALMKFMIKRFGWLYWFLAAFALLGPLAALLLASNNNALHWVNHPFFPMGLFIGLIWGAGLFSRELKKGGLLEFVIVRPVTRGEFYHSLLLVNGIPLVLLMLLPVVYAIILRPWFTLSQPLADMFLICLIAAAWIVFILLLGFNVGLLAVSCRSERLGRGLSAVIIAVLVALMVNLNNIVVLNGPANPAWQARNHPWLALAAALAVSAPLYYLGRRRVERMDI
jgi:ABC-type transport system involved in multi-copper enzyme maturation permease subunit